MTKLIENALKALGYKARRVKETTEWEEFFIRHGVTIRLQKYQEKFPRVLVYDTGREFSEKVVSLRFMVSNRGIHFGTDMSLICWEAPHLTELLEAVRIAILDNVKIESLGLSARTRKRLRHIGLNTVHQFRHLSLTQVMGDQNLDKKSAFEIYQRLSELGINLGWFSSE